MYMLYRIIPRNAVTSAMEALDRLREQRAARLLELLQSDLRAQVRVEQDAGRGQRRDRRARRQARAARLEDPAERQRLWAREAPAAFEGAPIRSLPKAREFWKDVDVTVWTKTELDAACALLDLPTRGRKRDLLARIQDWVLEPELLAERQRQKQRDSEYDAMIGAFGVFRSLREDMLTLICYSYRKGVRVWKQFQWTAGSWTSKCMRGAN